MISCRCVLLVYWRMFIKIDLAISDDYMRLRSAIRYMISSSYSRVARENRSVGSQCGPHAPLLHIFVWSIIFDIQINSADTRYSRKKLGDSWIRGYSKARADEIRVWMVSAKAFRQCNYYAIIERLSFILESLSRNTN